MQLITGRYSRKNTYHFHNVNICGNDATLATINVNIKFDITGYSLKCCISGEFGRYTLFLKRNATFRDHPFLQPIGQGQ